MEDQPMETAAEVLTFGNTNLPEGTPDRPLVTFAVFAYNQEKYIREAVEGAFAQTYSPLEIILSDDCSSDRTFEIMDEMAMRYCGPHLVKVRRGQTNLGTLGHVLTVSRQSRGKLIVVAAGDDISIPGRTSLLSYEFQESKPIVIYSRVCGISSGEVNQGQLPFACIFTGRRQTYGLGASAAYESKFLKSIPLPSLSVLHEDIFFASIISLADLKMKWIEDPLVLYRERETGAAQRGVKNNFDLTIGNLRLREQRIDYFLNLLKFCKTDIKLILDSHVNAQSVEAKSVEAYLGRSIQRYETLQIFYKSGIIGGWTRLNQIDQSSIAEIIRVLFGVKFFAILKSVYLTLAR